MKTNKNSFSQLLKNFIINKKSKKILVEDIVDIFEVNAFYILILIFSFIIIIPRPEQTALISSLINIIISIQIYI